MRTVSLELAKKLKEAGLQWEPKEGDVFSDQYDNVDRVFAVTAKDNCGDFILFSNEDWKGIGKGIHCKYLKRYFWLPTLADLLEWLEGRGYSYQLYDNYPCSEKIIRLYGREPGDLVCLVRLSAATNEDAAAKAVLWVLEQEGKETTQQGRE